MQIKKSRNQKNLKAKKIYEILTIHSHSKSRNKGHLGQSLDKSSKKGSYLNHGG